jgi:hypothetical protein
MIQPPLNLALILLCTPALQSAELQDPPGRSVTGWVGNSYGGDGGSNGQDYRVRQSADEIEVTSDGAILAGAGWDEAGRCAGLDRDGRVNRRLLMEHNGKGKSTAWGFGTGNNAEAADSSMLIMANSGKQCATSSLKSENGIVRVPVDPGFGVTVDANFVVKARPVRAD